MKKCFDCGYVFDEPTTYTEDLTPGEGFEGGSFINKYDGCPVCSGAFGSADECAYCCEWDYTCEGHYDGEGFVCQHCAEEHEEVVEYEY